MTPLSAFIQPARERKKPLKKEKHEVWRHRNREIINEKKRQWREKRSL
jgi:hypothetical protein